MSGGTEGEPEGPEPVPDEVRRSAGRWARGSAFAVLPAVVGLVALGVSVLDALLLGLILVVLPMLAVAQAVLLASVRVERLSAYLSSIVAMAFLATTCLAAAWIGWGGGGRLGGSERAAATADFLGLRAMPWPDFWVWTAGLTAGGLAILAVFRVGAGALGLREHAFLRALLPRTPLEKGAFVGVSLSAGVGEELVFRGYAIGALTPFVGLPLAVGLSTVSFGVVHAYQGGIGFLRTAALGGLLAWGYLASGSLLPAMAAHTLLDVVAGIFLGERLMVPDADSRV